jgi:NAD-dependent dihydropyrimidine dehydrogenase PreA subunit
MARRMIEVVSESRCTLCDLCIKVCPTNVFSRAPSGLPVIARQEDCQTCFQCEVYCPSDALFVSPLRVPAPDGHEWRDEAALVQKGLMGLYRQRVGWGKGPKPVMPSDQEFFAVIQSATAQRRPPPVAAAADEKDG